MKCYKGSNKVNPLNRLSIRSKFIILMLIVSISSIVAIGIIGDRSGEKILESSVSEELKSIKNSKAQQVENYFKSIENNLKMLSTNKMIIDSLREFIVSYNLTKYNALNKKQLSKVKDYYENTFIPTMEKNSSIKVSIDNILPKTVSANYLQYHYIIKNPYPRGSRDKLIKQMIKAAIPRHMKNIIAA